MTAPPSRPARALRAAVVVIAVGVVARVPSMRTQFAAALTAALPPEVPTGHSARSIRQSVTPPPLTADADVTGLTDPPRARRLAVLVITRHPRRAPEPATVATLMATEPPLAPLAPAPAPTPAIPTTADSGTIAAAAYARLAVGDRRGAVRLFDDALRGDDPRASTWRQQRAALVRRWSGSAYSVVRGSGPVGLTAEPVLGGGQSGGAIAFTPDPLAARPLSVTLRGSAGHDDAGRSGFAAVGVAWRPLAGVTVAAERRIAIGPAAHDDWTLRLAAGGDRTRGRFRLTAYGEGGIVGTSTYVAVQGRVAAVVHRAGVAVEPGVGTWASLQHDRATVDRVDIGPGVIVRAGVLAAQVDYRWRVAGNAAPASGPVLTLSAAF